MTEITDEILLHFKEIGDLKLTEGDQRADFIIGVCTELLQSRQDNAALTEKIEKLTPGGSEFHGDINKCIEWVKDRLYTTGKIAAERNALTEKLRLAVDRIDTYEEALQQIESWSKAYPLDIFPEPDFKKVRVLLGAGGITVDQVSASNMRHVVKGVGEIAAKALARVAVSHE